MMWSCGSERYLLCGVVEVKGMMWSSGSERYDVELWK
jgi:hypothetical protein